MIFSKWSCHFCFYLLLTYCFLSLKMIRVVIFHLLPHLIEVVLLHNLGCSCLIAVFTTSILFLCLYLAGVLRLLWLLLQLLKSNLHYWWRIYNAHEFTRGIFFTCALVSLLATRGCSWFLTCWWTSFLLCLFLWLFSLMHWMLANLKII